MPSHPANVALDCLHHGLVTCFCIRLHTL